jgi:hypothetical protein
MLKAGEFAFDRNTGKSVQVLERLEVWGYVSYRVFDPSTGTVYKVMEDSLSDSLDRIPTMRIICAMLRCCQRLKTKLQEDS